jgi:catechol 2,3-dioxygenase
MMSVTDAARSEPMFEVAHLAATELFSPRPDASRAFFENLLGMYVVKTDERSVYLRGYEDPYAYSLKITERDHPGVGVTCFRAMSDPALERRAEALTRAGLGNGWTEGAFGHGKAFDFHTPEGHRMRLLFDVEYAHARAGDETSLLNRPTKRPARGVPVRRIDHMNLYCRDVTVNKNAMIDLLGFRLSEHAVTADGTELSAWLRTTALVHDVAFTKDAGDLSGRLHHVAFWYGIPQHLMDVAELCVENDIIVEAGPGKHGISQALFLYVLEPGGNRIELFGDSGYLIFDPTWKPITWTEEQLAKGVIWIGSDLPREFFLYGTPTAGGLEIDKRVARYGKTAPATV